MPWPPSQRFSASSALAASVRISYRLENDRLLLALDDWVQNEAPTWTMLAKLGVPLKTEKGLFRPVRWVPLASLPQLVSACRRAGATLVPGEGAPPLDRLQAVAPRYEEQRPVDPDLLLRTAPPDETGADAIATGLNELRAFARANPEFAPRARRDVEVLERALEKRRRRPEPPANETAPADTLERRVSEAIRGVPGEDLWRARDLLLALHRSLPAPPAAPPATPIPESVPGFLGKLRSYQREGAGFVVSRNHNCILADDMGLGKTVMAIAAVVATNDRALVVCPANVLYNWAFEVERFTGQKARIWHGREVEGPSEARFLLATYDSLRLLDASRAGADAYPVLILDEAHYVRNAETQRARLVASLPQRRRLLLTGTPMVNGIEDYYELLLQVGVNRFGSAEDFRKTWLADGQLWQRHAKVREATAALLAETTRDVLLRRRKEEVLRELPPRTVQVHRHVLLPAEAAEYDRLAREAAEGLAKASTESAVFAHLHRLRQFLALRRVPFVAARVRELLDAGENAVVFAQYLEPLRELARELHPLAGTIDGSTPPRARERLARELGRDGGPRVLLVQLDAGGVGLNFVGAANVLFVHLAWTAAAHRQAVDRLHRIGQDKPVLVEFFVTPGTIDDRLSTLVLRKEADANLVLAEAQDVLNRGELVKALAADLAATRAPSMPRGTPSDS